MAAAFVKINRVSNDAGGVRVSLQVTLLGQDVATQDNQAGFDTEVVIAGADTAVQILTKLTDAVVNTAAGFGFTVARSAVLMPSFQRGV